MDKDFQYIFGVEDAGNEDLTCIWQTEKQGTWNKCNYKTILSDSQIVCTCPENHPVTIVEDTLDIYKTDDANIRKVNKLAAE